MDRLSILSGGAAQGLVHALAPAFRDASGLEIGGTFGAVGLMRKKLEAGEAADLVIFTRAMVEDLAREGVVDAASLTDLGGVATSIAVRAGDPLPAVHDGPSLAAAFAAADALFVPDMVQSTAGLHVAAVLARLGLIEKLRPRIGLFPNGAAAMAALATSGARIALGCTQATEIRATPGIVLVADLPAGFGLVTTYTAAVTARAGNAAAARRLIDLMTGDAAAQDRARLGFC